MNVRLGVFAALVLVTTAGLAAACSSSSSPATAGPPVPAADAEPDEDAEVDAGTVATKSCDPLTPRAADPEISSAPPA